MVWNWLPMSMVEMEIIQDFSSSHYRKDVIALETMQR